MEIIKHIKPGGIVLSGGAGRRMKKEKGLCQLKGKPMIAYVLDVLQPLCSEIIISANNDAYLAFGYPIVKDEVNGIGPLGGIYSALKFSKNRRNMIISCDMPFISTEMIQYIVDSSQDYQVVIPVFNGLPEPMCALYDRAILPGLEKMIDQKVYKLQEVSRFGHVLFLEISSDLDFYRKQLFANINSPDELALAEQQLMKFDEK